MKHCFAAIIALTCAGVQAHTSPAHAVFAVNGEKTVTYTCTNGKKIAVSYFTVNDTPLASASVKGKSLIFVNVLSASGAKYASGPYILWNKGYDVQLYDERLSGAASKPYGDCSAKRK